MKKLALLGAALLAAGAAVNSSMWSIRLNMRPLLDVHQSDGSAAA